MDLNKYIFINAYPIIYASTTVYDFTFVLYDLETNNIYTKNLSIDKYGNVKDSKFTRTIILYINKV